MRCTPPYSRGFTLMELSVVVVIIGIIAGSIVAGRDLLTQSKLRSVIAEADKYTKATALFQDTYHALPGDMSTATSVFGAATCPWGARTGTQTCNGDGDGRIYNQTLAASPLESFTYWQHLANANIIEGQYNGIGAGGSNTTITPGTNVPVSSWNKNSGWVVRYYAYTMYDPITAFTYSLFYWFQAESGHILTLMPSGTIQNIVSATSGVMPPADLFYIDTKIDDGRPGQGNVRSNPSSMGALNAVYDCADSNLAATAAYKVTTKTNVCMPIFVMNF